MYIAGEVDQAGLVKPFWGLDITLRADGRL